MTVTRVRPGWRVLVRAEGIECCWLCLLIVLLTVGWSSSETPRVASKGGRTGMAIGEQARRAAYVALGAADWTVEHARQAWRERDYWARQTRRAYAGLAQRGETVLGREAGAQLGSAEELPIREYDTLNVSQITPKLPALSQRDLARIADYENAHQARSTVLSRIDELRIQQP